MAVGRERYSFSACPIRLRTLLAACVVAVASLGAPALAAGGEPLDQIPVGPALTLAQRQDWSKIWNFVNVRCAAPGLRGLDWFATYKSVAQKIDGGLDNAGFTALVNEALAPIDDGHARYLPPERVHSEASSTTQSFTGVGFMLVRGTGPYAVVVTVIPGGPADQARLASHDRILAVDGSSPLDGTGRVDFHRFRGPAGSSVRLQVASPGGQPRDITITRAGVSTQFGLVVANLVPADRTGGRRIGYALLAGVDPAAAAHLRSEFARLSADAPLDGLILDLRGNGGGEIEGLVDVIGLFYGGATGTIHDRGGGRYMLPESGAAIGNSRSLPLAVLVHRGTVSGGEILAGTLQDAGRARLVGDRTDGCAGSLVEMQLDGGGVISVTGGTFLLPGGRDPGWLGRGVVPDITVPGCSWDEVTSDRDPAIEKAIEVLAPPR